MDDGRVQAGRELAFTAGWNRGDRRWRRPAGCSWRRRGGFTWGGERSEGLRPSARLLPARIARRRTLKARGRRLLRLIQHLNQSGNADASTRWRALNGLGLGDGRGSEGIADRRSRRAHSRCMSIIDTSGQGLSLFGKDWLGGGRLRFQREHSRERSSISASRIACCAVTGRRGLRAWLAASKRTEQLGEGSRFVLGGGRSGSGGGQIRRGIGGALDGRSAGRGIRANRRLQQLRKPAGSGRSG